MAVKLDRRQSGTSGTGASSFTWSHTIPGGLAQAILIVFSTHGSGGNVTASTVVWDDGGANTALTRLGRVNDSAAISWAEIWYLVNPAPGTKNVKVTYGGAVDGCTGSASYHSVDQTNPWLATSPQTAIGTAPTQPTLNVTSGSGETVVACVIDNMSTVDTLVVGAGQSTIHNITVGSSNAGASSDELGIPTTVMSWSGIGGSGVWAEIGGALQDAAEAPMVTMGVDRFPSAYVFYVGTKRFFRPAASYEVVASGTSDAVGSSDGTSAADAIGEATAEAEGVAFGVATAQATGSALASADGSSDGTSTVQATGVALATAVGSTAGTSTVSGVGISTAASIAAASGASTVQATGEATGAGVASSAGTTTVTAVGASTAASVASSASASTVQAVADTGTSVAVSAGTSTVQATGASTATGAASSVGVSTATATASATSAGVAASSGTSTASAEGTTAAGTSATASAVGTSTAVGISQAIVVWPSVGPVTVTSFWPIPTPGAPASLGWPGVAAASPSVGSWPALAPTTPSQFWPVTTPTTVAPSWPVVS